MFLSVVVANAKEFDYTERFKYGPLHPAAAIKKKCDHIGKVKGVV